MEDYVPMTPADYDRLKAILGSFPSTNAMNLEELDGFFCALACSPEDVAPEDFFPPVWGTVEDADALFPDLKAAQEFIGLVNRHYGGLLLRLEAKDDFEPMLLANESGELVGADWAWGFVRGMAFEPDAWGELLDDEEDGELLAPVLILAQERGPDPDPELLPAAKPITADEREVLLCALAAAAPLIYDYFWQLTEGDQDEDEPPPLFETSLVQSPHRRGASKVGRNESCSCGSGKKYKRCCGADGV
jgi:uncharacterized protein